MGKMSFLFPVGRFLSIKARNCRFVDDIDRFDYGNRCNGRSDNGVCMPTHYAVRAKGFLKKTHFLASLCILKVVEY